MYKLILIVLFAFSINANAQDSLQSFSYYFETNSCDVGKSVENFPSTKFATFNLKSKSKFDLRADAGDELKIDETGLYIEKNKILNISREVIREDSKYSIRNGYLHGVTPTDSFAVALQDELYYFLMPTKTYLFDKLSPNQSIYEIDNATFIVLTRERNKYYSALQVKFNKTQIELSELDLSQTQVEAISHNLTTENDIQTFLLNPTKKDWEIIFTAFVIYDRYVGKK